MCKNNRTFGSFSAFWFWEAETAHHWAQDIVRRLSESVESFLFKMLWEQFYRCTSVSFLWMFFLMVLPNTYTQKFFKLYCFWIYFVLFYVVLKQNNMDFMNYLWMCIYSSWGFFKKCMQTGSLRLLGRSLHLSVSSTTIIKQTTALLGCIYYERLCANLMLLAALAFSNILWNTPFAVQSKTSYDWNGSCLCMVLSQKFKYGILAWMIFCVWSSFLLHPDFYFNLEFWTFVLSNAHFFFSQAGFEKNLRIRNNTFFIRNIFVLRVCWDTSGLVLLGHHGKNYSPAWKSSL